MPTARSETVLLVAPGLLMVMVPLCSPAAVGANVTVMVVEATVPSVGASVALLMEKTVPVVTSKVMSSVRLLPDTVNVAVVVLPTTTEPHSTEVPDTVMVGVDGSTEVAQAVQPSLPTLKLASNEPQHDAVLNVSPALSPHKYSAKHG